MTVNIWKSDKWPTPSWLVGTVGRALHRYRKGHGFKFHTAWNFSRPYFQCCWSSVRYSARIASILVTLSDFMIFIYLQSFIALKLSGLKFTVFIKIINGNTNYLSTFLSSQLPECLLPWTLFKSQGCLESLYILVVERSNYEGKDVGLKTIGRLGARALFFSPTVLECFFTENNIFPYLNHQA